MRLVMFRIKICGITNVEDALAAVDAGADAIGLNFYPQSSRCVKLDVAMVIASLAYDRGATPVGVFVNHTSVEMDQTATAARLSVCQLHGDETPEMAKRIFDLGRDIIRVRRYRTEEGVLSLQHDWHHYATVVGYSPSAYLIDAASASFGGSGKTLPWDEIRECREAIGTLPLILAGGLTPDNVAEAIGIVRPHGVDVASGVESAPGKKDPHKVRDFVAAALGAFER